MPEAFDSSTTDQTRPSAGRGLALLQLVRLPTVFSAGADIALGFLLTHPTLEPAGTFGLLLAASISLYWTGMILNDYFDREIDAQERPGRPIPSGRVSATTALLLALSLNAAGLGIAAVVGNNSLLIAAAVTLSVWLYDGALKKTLIAPLVMGSCRFFNVMLGASASPTGQLWCLPQTHVALGFGLYIVGLTWFARQEAKTSSRSHLLSATFVINVGLCTLLAFLLHAPEREQRNTALFVFCVIAVTVIRRLIRAISDPSPERVQTAVKIMLLSYITLSASIILFAASDPVYAVGVAALLIPAFLLSRRIPMT
ncbi:MAG: UbiA family prenyltransferase [Planctomycetota bacterium]|jgi:4-hydroxybenzoate polyprenyltransferase